MLKFINHRLDNSIIPRKWIIRYAKFCFAATILKLIIVLVVYGGLL